MKLSEFDLRRKIYFSKSMINMSFVLIRFYEMCDDNSSPHSFPLKRIILQFNHLLYFWKGQMHNNDSNLFFKHGHYHRDCTLCLNRQLFVDFVIILVHPQRVSAIKILSRIGLSTRLFCRRHDMVHNIGERFQNWLS